MSYERPEKRTYRKSPGRQYGYEYDPLRSQPLDGNRQSGRLGASPQSEPLTGILKDSGALDGRQVDILLAPRPNLHRTRQLQRQYILETKAKAKLEADTGKMDPDINMDAVDSYGDDQGEYEDIYSPAPARRRPGSARVPSQSLRVRRPAREYIEPDEDYAPPPPQFYDDEQDYLDPDVGYEYDDDPLARRTGYRTSLREPVIEPELPPQTGRRYREPVQEPLEEPDTGEREERPARKKRKKGLLSRRKLIAGAILVGGGAVAAYELGPKIPPALENAGSNIEHQLADAFSRGFAAGGEAVRKELINSLDTLEGVSLDAAIGAAKLTRVAYDVFVSPIVTLAANIADDFLTALLNALITARNWLKQINADNATLVALTSILQNWVTQVHVMPKKLQTITDTDLDGAQTYLNALQRTIQEQQAILNGQAKPTPTARPGASATPGPHTTATP
jgi:hypothetical protein